MGRAERGERGIPAFPEADGEWLATSRTVGLGHISVGWASCLASDGLLGGG